jgi:hypothetical protein
MCKYKRVTISTWSISETNDIPLLLWICLKSASIKLVNDLSGLLSFLNAKNESLKCSKSSPYFSEEGQIRNGNFPSFDEMVNFAKYTTKLQVTSIETCNTHIHILLELLSACVVDVCHSGKWYDEDFSTCISPQHTICLDIRMYGRHNITIFLVQQVYRSHKSSWNNN